MTDRAALDRVFMALADQTRRQLVHRLARKECTVNELAEPFSMSLNAISKHLKVLENAGMIRRRIDGRTHYCSLKPQSLMGALDWITVYTRFWTDQLQQLETHLQQPQED